MVGSQGAAGTGSPEAVARSGDRLRRYGFAAALLAPALLAGCSAPLPAQVGPAPEAPPTPAAAGPPPEPPSEAVASRIPELGKLAGLDEAELVAMLGQPDFRRSDPPAQLWQYRSADCVLDVFLYSEPSGYRVVHSETHDPRVLPPSIGPCQDAGAFADRARQSRL